MALGPAGALLYRLAALLQEQWLARNLPQSSEATEGSEFTRFAARAFEVIDWLPARLTAASFAVVGNFQDAVDCWRTQSAAWADRAQGIILASGAGALGVKLGGAVHEYGRVRYRPELGIGDDADTDYLSSAVGLIWRALVMWVLLLAVVTFSRLLG
jgi:cobalamin biosynthesis protein CobD/CbiB